MTRTLGLLTATAILVFSGLVHGLWTNRWSEAEDVKATIARLDRLPMALGDWDGQPLAVGERERRAAGGGYLMRRYVNRRTGAVVSILIVCGRAGPVCVHTPDVCYEGAGYHQVGASVKQAIGGPGRPGAGFWSARFHKEDARLPTEVRVFWAWNGGDGWRAVDEPRRTFAGYPVLHKLYVTRRLAGSEESVRGEPCVDFLKVLLPALQEQVQAGQ
jgi:hypothetical protein